MSLENFEKQLQRQPIRPVPGEWRAEILKTAQAASCAEPSNAKPQTSSWWRELLWPCPQAWAGLATVWLIVLAVNFLAAEKTDVIAKQAPPPSPEVMMALREQQRVLARLIESYDEPLAEPPKPFIPRPRGECRAAIRIA
jgi:hypothetical protein